MTQITPTNVPSSADFSSEDLREELVDSLWDYVSDAIDMYLQRDDEVAELDTITYQEKRQLVVDYLDDHLVIRFIRWRVAP